MKLAFLVPNHLDYGVGGSGIVSTLVAKYFLTRGVEIVALTPVPKSDFKINQELLKYEKINRLKVHHTENYGLDGIKGGRVPAKMVEVARNMGVNLNLLLRYYSATSQIKDLVEAKYVWAGPDNICAITSAILLSKAEGIAICQDDTSLRLVYSEFVMPTQTKEHSDGVLTNIMMGHKIQQSTISMHRLLGKTKQRLASMSSHESQLYSVRGIGNCYHLQTYTPHKEISIYKKDNTDTTRRKILEIVHIGNLGPSPSSSFIAELERSLSIIKDKNLFEGKIRIHLIGKKASWLPTSKLVEENKEWVEFIFHGWLNEKDMDILLGNIDLAINYSNYPVGVRTRVADYLSRGLCVISHVSAAISLTYLKHKTNCLLAYDPESLSNALQYASENPVEILNIRKNGHKAYWEHHDPDVNITKAVKECLPSLAAKLF